MFRGFLLKRIAERFGFAAGNAVQAIIFGFQGSVPPFRCSNPVEPADGGLLDRLPFFEIGLPHRSQRMRRLFYFFSMLSTGSRFPGRCDRLQAILNLATFR